MTVQSKDITLKNGNQIQIVQVSGGESAKTIASTFGSELPEAVIAIIDGGGTEAKATELSPDRQDPVYQLLSQGVAATANKLNAMILGSGLGPMASMVGRGQAYRDQRAPLVGVAPASMISLNGDQPGDSPEPNHTHLILVEDEDQEKHIMVELADTFFKSSHKTLGAVVMVLVHGGDQAREAVLRGIRKGWTLVVLAGSGGLADQLAEANLASPDISPDLRDILQEGHLHIFPKDGSPERLKRILTELIQGDDMLKMAWRRFASFDLNAIAQDKQFFFVNRLILILGILGTAFGLASTHLPTDLAGWEQIASRTLHYTIVAIPIIVSVLAAASNFFKSGTKRLAYRAAAESVKREIFMYRAGACKYRANADKPRAPQAYLAERLKSVSDHLMTTDVNESAITPYKGPIPPKRHGRASTDMGLNPLSAADYIRFRLEDQLDSYQSKTNQLNKQMRFFHWTIYVMGGLGTLIAAFGFDHWIALTTSIAAALTSYLKYRAIEENIVKCNQTATNLENVRGWWLSLSAADQKNPAFVDELINQTELIFENEISSWVSRMQNAIADAPITSDGQETEGEKEETNPVETPASNSSNLTEKP